MRGPGENAKSTQQEEHSLKGSTCTESSPRRDPCSSPPCKKLKQVTLQDSTGPNEVTTFKSGGLVTALASTPNKETILTSECDDVMVFDMRVTNNQSPKSLLSPNQDTSTTNLPNTPVKHLSSAEKKKKKEERENMKEAKKKEREEKIKQREQAKAVKEKERLEAKQKKEQEKQERLAEKERREKDRLERKIREEKEKQEKKEKREEEKRKKEEEQNAKQEEKRKKEEEKKQIEEEMERKKLKARNSFKSFFTKTPLTTPKTLPKSVLKFEPFEIKPNMRLAPRFRSEICKESKKKLDMGMELQVESNLYLQNLPMIKHLLPYTRAKRKKSAKMSVNVRQDSTSLNTNSIHSTTPVIEVIDDDDEADDNSESSSIVEIPDDDKKTVYMKAVFLKFYENNRPPYYGTQRKRSKIISPKNPFKKDKAMLNYEVDSDDEWEEEEPGESLSDSEPEDNNEEENEECDEEDEDGWMVPHGYLSDDEGIHEDDEDSDENTLAKKEQQLAKAKAWEAELKKRCKAMKPICIGCVWPDYKEINDVLKRFEACLLVDGPSISVSLPTSVVLDDVQKGEAPLLISPDAGCSSTAMYVPEEAMPDLIQLIHGSTDGLEKLVNTFQYHWSSKRNHTGDHPTLKGKGHISKRQLSKKIRAIAKKESRLFEKPRWFVIPGVLESYGLDGLKAESEVQEPINRGINPPDIKQFTRPEPEFSKPVALPVNNLFQVLNEPSFVQCVESQAIHSHFSAPEWRASLPSVMYINNVMETTSASLQTPNPNPNPNPKPMDCCVTKITNNAWSATNSNEMKTFKGTLEASTVKKLSITSGQVPTSTKMAFKTVRDDVSSKHETANIHLEPAPQMKNGIKTGSHCYKDKIVSDNKINQTPKQEVSRSNGHWKSQDVVAENKSSEVNYSSTNHEILNKNAELQLVTFKRQIPSPESNIRASKVLKREDSAMNNNFNNFTISC